MKMTHLFLAGAIAAATGAMAMSQAHAMPISQSANLTNSGDGAAALPAGHVLLVQWPGWDGDGDGWRNRRWRGDGDGDGGDWRWRQRRWGDGDGDGDGDYWRRQRMRRQWCYYHPGRC